MILEDEGELSIEDLIADEDVAITVTDTGYIKRTPISTYRNQKRGGKGRIGMRTREEDVVNHLFVASTHAYMMVFSDRGRAYWLKVHEIPDVGADGRGKAIANLVQMEAGEKIAAMLAGAGVRRQPLHRDGHAQGHDQEDRARRRSATRAPAASSPWASRTDDAVMAVQLSDGAERGLHRHAATGMAIRFPEDDVRSMGRTAYGVRGIQLREGDEVVAMEVVKPGGTLLTVTEKGYAKRTDLDEYRVQSRGGLGLKNLEITDKNGLVVSIAQVHENEELLVITEQGKILRTPAERHPDDRPRHAGRARDGSRRRRQRRLGCACRPRRRSAAGRDAGEPPVEPPARSEPDRRWKHRRHARRTRWRAIDVARCWSLVAACRPAGAPGGGLLARRPSSSCSTSSSAPPARATTTRWR